MIFTVERFSHNDFTSSHFIFPERYTVPMLKQQHNMFAPEYEFNAVPDFTEPNFKAVIPNKFLIHGEWKTAGTHYHGTVSREYMPLTDEMMLRIAKETFMSDYFKIVHHSQQTKDGVTCLLVVGIPLSHAEWVAQKKKEQNEQDVELAKLGRKRKDTPETPRLPVLERNKSRKTQNTMGGDHDDDYSNIDDFLS